MTDTSQDGTEPRLAEFTELLATAIENADAREAVQQLVDEQAALRRMATLVAREPSQAEVFGAIAEEIGRLIGAQAIRMLRYERDSTALVVASWGVDGDVFPQVGFRAKLGGDNATSRVFQTGQAVRIDNYEEASGPIGEAVKATSPLRSSVATPIIVEGRMWGVVIAGTSDTEPMPPDTESRLRQFSDLMATAIANAESREALAELADEQAALRRVATLVAQDVTPSEIFSAVSEEVTGLFRAGSAVLRFDDEGPAVVHTGTAGWSLPMGTRWELEEGMAATAVYRTGRSARVDDRDWSSDTGPWAAVARQVGLVSSVVSPIVVEGRLWGAMSVASAEELLPLDTESRLEKFTELVATAIANAESREAVSRLATEQAALRRVATLVAQDVRRSEIFAAVAEEVAGLFQTTGSVLRFEEGGEAAVIVGVAKVDIPLGLRLEFEEGMGMIEVYRTGQPARVDHVNVDRSNWSSDEGSVVATAGHLGLVSSVVSPIVAEGRTWGVIGISSTDDPLPLDTESRLEKFTELVATAIANAESREALSRLAAEQAALRRVATLVAAQASPDEIYAAVAAEVARLLRADRGAVVRYEPDDTLTVTAYWSTDGTDVPIGTRIPLEGDVVTATVRKKGRPIRIDTYDGLSGPLVDYARTVGALPPSTVAAPIFVEGRAWGTIFVSTMKADPFPDDAESRVMLFTELLATAIANAENRSELAASRKRLVAASDEARRRIERDLHDGTQQRLVSLALAARAAAAELPTGSSDAREKFSSIATGLGEAVEDLQELSRGIHPAILSDAGLGPALETLALRSPIPVELEVRTRERFPEPVEVAAYFTASESLANAAKHSQASRITVLLAFENERLRLSVRDDGIGGADPGRGSGLVGLRDRVEALGGTLAIESGSGAGTSLSATLPVGDPGDPTI